MEFGVVVQGLEAEFFKMPRLENGARAVALRASELAMNSGWDRCFEVEAPLRAISARRPWAAAIKSSANKTKKTTHTIITAWHQPSFFCCLTSQAM